MTVTYTISLIRDAEGQVVRVSKQREQDRSGRGPGRGPGALRAGQTREVLATGVPERELGRALKTFYHLHVGTRVGVPLHRRGVQVRKAKVIFAEVDAANRHYEFPVPAWPPLESY